MTTTSFALRTSPEFKEAAKALAETGWALLEPVPGKDFSVPVIGQESINSAFNSLIAKGVPAMLTLIEVNLTERLKALDIAQEIIRFLLDHPAARIALAANFAEDSSARRVIEAIDAAKREADETGGRVREAVRGLSAAESIVWDCFEIGDINLESASKALADCQSNVSKLSAAKGALQRAMATRS